MSNKKFAIAAVFSLFTLVAGVLPLTAHADHHEADAFAEVRTHFNNALTELEKLAGEGNAEAKYYLGSLKMHGIIAEKDAEAGLKLLKESAEAGHSGAHSLLSDYYKHGYEVDKDEAKAAEHMKAASK